MPRPDYSRPALPLRAEGQKAHDAIYRIIDGDDEDAVSMDTDRDPQTDRGWENRRLILASLAPRTTTRPPAKAPPPDLDDDLTVTRFDAQEARLAQPRDAGLRTRRDRRRASFRQSGAAREPRPRGDPDRRGGRDPVGRSGRRQLLHLRRQSAGHSDHGDRGATAAAQPGCRSTATRSCPA